MDNDKLAGPDAVDETEQQQTAARTDEAAQTEPAAEAEADRGKPAEKTYTQKDVDELIAIQKAKIPDKEELRAFRAWKEKQAATKEPDPKDAALAAELDEATKRNAQLAAQLSALKAGVDADAVDDVVHLASHDAGEDADIDTAIKAVLEKHPVFTGRSKQRKPPAIIRSQVNGTVARGINETMNALIRGVTR